MTAPDSLYAEALGHQYLMEERDDPHHRAICQRLLTHFDLTPSCRVLEIGAGFGRYTSLLRSFGLRVIASEPDPRMFEVLQGKFGEDPMVECSLLPAEGVANLGEDFNAICGFHVLHHLRPSGLRSIADLASYACRKRHRFRGWFFLEPNNLNPLYLLQIAITRGIRFSEERGIWQTDYQRQMGRQGGPSVLLGRIGLFPPRGVFAGLPSRLATMQTELVSGPTPWSLYRVFGERCEQSGIPDS
jgi:SAM-dependent methyltransferase